MPCGGRQHLAGGRDVGPGARVMSALPSRVAQQRRLATGGPGVEEIRVELPEQSPRRAGES